MRGRTVLVPWWTAIVFPLLAGFGIAWLLDFLPELWQDIMLGAIALAAIPWAIRQYRWAGRQRQLIEDNMAELQRLAERQ